MRDWVLNIGRSHAKKAHIVVIYHKRWNSTFTKHWNILDVPNSNSFTSLAALSPSARRFLSIILLRSTAALSSALSVQPMFETLSCSNLKRSNGILRTLQHFSLGVKKLSQQICLLFRSYFTKHRQLILPTDYKMKTAQFTCDCKACRVLESIETENCDILPPDSWISGDIGSICMLRKWRLSGKQTPWKLLCIYFRYLQYLC